jgi:hypothetical protein
MAVVAVVVSDLMFQPRVETALRALGAEPRVLPGGAFPLEAAALVVDLHEPGADVPALIAEAHAAGARVLAFGRHTDVEALRAARASGADAVVPRSQLVEELPSLLAVLLDGASAGA